MPKKYDVKSNFSTGEITPELAAQTSFQQRGKGLESCENFISNIYGGLETRPGTKFVGNIRKFPDTPSTPSGVSLFFNETVDGRITLGDGNVTGAPPVLKLINQWTLEAWAYPFDDTGFKPLINLWRDLGGPGAQRLYSLVVQPNILKRIQGFASTTGNDFFGVTGPNGSLITNEWHHYAAVFDPPEVRVFADGVLVGTLPTAALSSRPPITTDFFIGGGIIGNADRFYHGYIAECRVWQVSRSTNDIITHKDDFIRTVEPDLVGYWPLIEGAGTTAFDYSGQGNNAPIGSGCSWEPLIGPIPNENTPIS